MRPDVPAREFAQPDFRDLRRVQGSSNAHKDDAFFFRGGVPGPLDGRSLRQHGLDQRRLIVDRFVDVIRMGCASIGHLLFLLRG